MDNFVPPLAPELHYSFTLKGSGTLKRIQAHGQQQGVKNAVLVPIAEATQV
jgi:hypothetical protein